MELANTFVGGYLRIEGSEILLRRLLEILGVYKLYEYWLMRQVRDGEMPSHVALILDGNRRWAIKRGLPPWLGHRKGADKVEELLDWCLELGIRTVTLYVFSTENFRRPKREVEELMKLFEESLERLLRDERIYKNEIRVKALGRLYLLPERIQELLKKVERRTSHFDKFYLNIAIAYGGRAEITDAVRKIARDVRAGRLSPEEINEKVIERYLYTAHLPNPEPDLIIRTSGEERLSGFLLWQSAYSELCFLDVYWPDFRKIDFLRAIRTYQRRQRRFGR